MSPLDKDTEIQVRQPRYHTITACDLSLHRFTIRKRLATPACRYTIIKNSAQSEIARMIDVLQNILSTRND